jgi:hypothetical protein
MAVQPLSRDRIPKFLHQPLVEPEVVLGHEHRAQDLA